MEKYTIKTLQVEFDNPEPMPPMPENKVRVVRMTVGQAERAYPDLLGDLHQWLWAPGTSPEEMEQARGWDIEMLLDYDKGSVEVWTLLDWGDQG